MSSAARLGDTCSGHDCFPPRHSVSGSNNVYINGIPAHRVTDAWEAHTCITTHDSILAQGSSSVFINGLAAGRIGDLVACGSTIATGSDNVFIG